MESGNFKLSQEELDSIISLRNLAKENVEKIGKLNIQKYFLESELEFVKEQLSGLYTESMKLNEQEKSKIDEVVGKYGEGKLDFATGIYTVD
jgi:methyltransferase-like protein